MLRARRSPPARGWPGRRHPIRQPDGAFPARAGMARRGAAGGGGGLGVPRPRGDGPMGAPDAPLLRVRSPPARGWPASAHRDERVPRAFPARAGMARPTTPPPIPRSRVPRPRGDGPLSSRRCAGVSVRSPPARGWPAPSAIRTGVAGAFPARAGMARSRFAPRGACRRVPRPRGDGPIRRRAPARPMSRSPPARGWPGRHVSRLRRRAAFPARAGMARTGCATRKSVKCVPRPRGDGPPRRAGRNRPMKRSPPARGWPGEKGLVRRRPHGVPRPRGDGPAHIRASQQVQTRSPPARGWPADLDPGLPVVGAFPARAGMARRHCCFQGGADSVPRPRGDGPDGNRWNELAAARSPPARGWPD